MYKSLRFIHNSIKCIIVIACLTAFSQCFALPFTIAPQLGTQLPTSIFSGSTATAFYTVKNNTAQQRNNNFIKYLPLNVVQDTSGVGVCGARFDLPPNGSCILKVTIRGAVNSNDSDISHHLFACFPGGTVCSGTSYPLNVTVLPISAFVQSITVTPSEASKAKGLTQQYSAIGIYSDGTSRNISNIVQWISSNPNIATLSTTGLATTAAIGETNITASISSVTSNQANFTVTAPALTSISLASPATSVARGATLQFSATGNYTDASTQNLSTTATWNSSDVSIATINNNGLASGISSGNAIIGASFQGVSSNPIALSVVGPALVSIAISPFGATVLAGTNKAYTAIGTYADSTTAPITTGLTWSSQNPSVATIDSAGLATSLSNGLTQIKASAGSPVVTSNTALLSVGPHYVYMANDFFVNTATTCLIDPNTQLLPPIGSCTTTSAIFNAATSIAINSTGTFAYVVNSGNNTIVYCPIVNGILTTPCNDVGGSGVLPSAPYTITVWKSPTSGVSYAYISNWTANTVTYCDINANGTFNVCNTTASSAALSSPRGITINPAGTKAYIASINNNNIYYCDVNSDGSLTSCNVTLSGQIASPYSFAFNPAGTIVYIVRFASGMSYCNVNLTDGTFNSCTNAPFFNPGSNFALNSVGNFGYTANGNSGTVTYVPINANGSTGATSTYTANRPGGIAVY